MSSPGDEAPTDAVSTIDRGPTGGVSRPSSIAAALSDAGLVLAWSVVAGALAGLVWWKLVDLPQATRQGASVVIDAAELGKQVNIDGWFFVLALVGGLVSGVVLLFLRERDPLLMVVLVTLGGGLASLVARQVGRWLGPGDAQDTLRHRANGAHALVPLQVHAVGVLWVWPAAAALGALVFLWVLKAPESEPGSGR